MFKLKMDTMNAAFQPVPAEEVARILNEVVEKLLKGHTEGKMYDINGNPIGDYKLTKR
jgi:hypothetical protein